MKYFVTASAYSVMGVVHAEVRVLEIHPELPKSTVLEVARDFPDRGRDDPKKYAVDVLMQLVEEL